MRGVAKGGALHKPHMPGTYSPSTHSSLLNSPREAALDRGVDWAPTNRQCVMWGHSNMAHMTMQKQGYVIDQSFPSEGLSARFCLLVKRSKPPSHQAVGTWATVHIVDTTAGPYSGWTEHRPLYRGSIMCPPKSSHRIHVLWAYQKPWP